MSNMVRCPGQDQRYWKPEDIFEVQCPHCGNRVEFFKDEPKLKCRHCGNQVANPRIDLGCAEWCQFAEQCLGLKKESVTSVCDKLIEEMKNVFGGDTRRINHALSVLDFAEKIQAAEGGDALVVKAAAVLHDIGIQQAERKYNSNAGKYQEIEGPPIARDILEKCEISQEAIEHICKIIANHHSAKNIDTLEFRIIWDADNIVNLRDEPESFGKEKIQKIVEKRFKTETGRKTAQELFCQNNHEGI
jgi:HD superfamily phosphohydrolase YqeK